MTDAIIAPSDNAAIGHHWLVDDNGKLIGKLICPPEAVDANVRAGQRAVASMPPHPLAIWDGSSWADPSDAVKFGAAEQAAWEVIRTQRNALLETWRWTILPDSPLSAECQTLFTGYLRQLNRVTVDFQAAADVQWPSPPTISYPPAS